MWDSHQWTHLARVTLAFCPPLSVTPLSPTGVASPYGSCLKSSFRQHASTTCWNHSLSNSCPNRIFSLSVPENTQGSCAAYPRLPTMSTLPFSGFNSPKRQWRRVDCREKNTCYNKPLTNCMCVLYSFCRWSMFSHEAMTNEHAQQHYPTIYCMYRQFVHAGTYYWHLMYVRTYLPCSHRPNNGNHSCILATTERYILQGQSSSILYTNSSTKDATLDNNLNSWSCAVHMNIWCSLPLPFPMLQTIPSPPLVAFLLHH